MLRELVAEILPNVPEEHRREFGEMLCECKTPAQYFDFLSLLWAYSAGGLDAPKAVQKRFTTTQYTCGVCGQRKSRVTYHQDRAGDEGASLLVECQCGHFWRMRQ